MFDGETLQSRWGHSAGCVTLSDGTVVVSVFGGFTTLSLSSIVGNPCFYQWGKSMIIVFQEVGSVSFAVFRPPSSRCALFWPSTNRSCSTADRVHW